MKKYIYSAFVFLLNVLLMLFGYLAIKQSDKGRLAKIEENNRELKEISPAVYNAQNEIATDRENKLRNLNNTPKAIKQKQTTTTTQSTTTKPKPSTTTKTS
jgi:hypothetical protein